MLVQIGIDAAAAAAARPRRRSYAERFQVGLAHARAFADLHGNLAIVTHAAMHDSYPLGQWLGNQRRVRRSDRRPLSADRAQALADIDPWWNPPWALSWQRHYYRARDAAAAGSSRLRTASANSTTLVPLTGCGASAPRTTSSAGSSSSSSLISASPPR
ncbi:helicase associated domain-containing protein [Streptomyces sp. MBT42]|uniref:helicase associated domain-containing protein n=1 Tax=Streptomyces sp. MBT42 TaxID=1488373 RepID=UPI001E3D376D|nr:helicase associated domain-containing protein [Streptomyces sp. MBT42]MCD2469587.1 helicase associated domain-containing protein [Streptomyces sp. MBT42]